MLQTVMDFVHNYFVKAPNPGKYTIQNGNLSPLPALLDGQRFWIVGSILNDGVYTYHSDGIKNDDDSIAVGLRDETFTGSVCTLAVPPAVIELTGEINAWVDKNSEAVNSPYTSENVIGVYSYTKASGGTGAGGAISWQDVFKSRLDRWRKVSLL